MWKKMDSLAIITLDLSVLLMVLDDGTFVVAAEFDGADFLAVSPADTDFTFDFSLSLLPLSFWTIFAYEDVAVDDDTFLVVDSSLVAAEIADILSRSPVFFDCRFRLSLVLDFGLIRLISA